MGTKKKYDMGYFNPVCDFVGSEKDIEQHLFDNIHEVISNCGLPEIARVEQQYTINLKHGRMIADIMIWHTDGTGTVIEVKKSQSQRTTILMAISQLLLYGIMIKDALGATPRMIVASERIDPELFVVVDTYKLPISFLMCDGDRFVFKPNVK